MHSFHYGSDLIGGSLQVRESRIVADLLLQDASPEQWHEAIQQQNQGEGIRRKLQMLQKQQRRHHDKREVTGKGDA